MTEQELHNYLKHNFPQENEKCEWKEFKSLKHAIAGSAGDDIISYISAIANMKGGHLVIGVEDGTLNIVGVRDFHNYTAENIKCFAMPTDEETIEPLHKNNFKFMAAITKYFEQNF